MTTRIRVGVVDYLNSRPLAWTFLTGHAPASFDVVYRSPAKIADDLREGSVDVGLVPSIEVQRIPGVKILDCGCIAAQREARSVLLLSKVPPSEIQRVALDENSRTSAALVRILLSERYGCQPAFSSARPRLDEMLTGADAALIIGDPALEVSTDGLVTLDLASEWRELTGLPFVFAVWALRAGYPTATGVEEIVRVFRQSRARGLAELPRIAREASESFAVAAEELEAYLSENLSYSLGRDERLSLEAFYRRARRFGLIDGLREIEFVT